MSIVWQVNEVQYSVSMVYLQKIFALFQANVITHMVRKKVRISLKPRVCRSHLHHKSISQKGMGHYD